MKKVNRKAVTFIAICALVVIAIALAVIKGSEGSAIHNAQERVKAAMFDADSVQFRYMYHNESEKSVCGQVNGKNAFGEMTGFQNFYVDLDGSGMVVLVPDEGHDYWQKYCGSSPYYREKGGD
jgi:hypothetical protein